MILVIVDLIVVKKNAPLVQIPYKDMEMNLEEIAQEEEYVIMRQDYVNVLKDFMEKHVIMK